MTRPLPLLVLCLLFTGTGCMTALRGDKQKVLVDSDPTGATVTIDGKSYTTPFETVLYRKKSYDVAISKPGYRAEVFEFKARGDGMSEPALVLPGGSLIYGTDQVSGASRSFGKLATIKLVPVDPVLVQTTTQPVRRWEYDGTLYDTAEARDAAIKARQEAQMKAIQNVKRAPK